MRAYALVFLAANAISLVCGLFILAFQPSYPRTVTHSRAQDVARLVLTLAIVAWGAWVLLP